jgi:hypothetical protein
LSVSGTTLNLAAALLTVSVLPGHFEGETAGGAVGSIGLGQPVGQRGGNGGPSGSGDEPGAEDEGSTTGPPPSAEAPPWERLSIGLERAWEEARAAIRELEGRWPLAGHPKPSAGSAVVGPPRPAAPPPSRPPTRGGTETGSRSTAPAVPTMQASAPSERGPAAASRTIDAALEDLGSERSGEGPSAGAPWWFGDVLAARRPAVTARALVAVIATASAAGAAGTAGVRWFRRRRLASTRLC